MNKVIAVGRIDIGKKRTQNEDRVLVCNKKIGALPNLYIVADGMGGHKAGAVASKLAIDAFCAYLESHSKASIEDDEKIITLLKTGVGHANHVIYKTGMEDIELQGMGTTLTLCTVLKGKVYVAHVGDTRLYGLSPHAIFQMTTDHSWVQEMLEKGYISEKEMQEHPKRNIITRAVGTYETIKVDTFVYELNEMEYLLLCSDGLTSMIMDQEIHRVEYGQSEELEDIVQTLIQVANEKGGLDNIAVIIGKICEVRK